MRFVGKPCCLIFKVANNDIKQENNKKSEKIKNFMGEPLNFVKKINFFGKIYGKKYSLLIFLRIFNY